MLEIIESKEINIKKLSSMQIEFNNIRLKYGNTGQMTISNSFVHKYSDLLH